MADKGSILIVAGEASADVHGAEVLRALRAKSPLTQAFGVGGAAMAEAGFEALIPAEQMSVAGLTEVLLALPRMLLYLRRLVKAARERRPKVAVLIDLPDFNLPLAKRLKRLGIPVVYYISPQIWAWRQRRVRQIRDRVDQMLVILPFEESFYRDHGVNAVFVGHPLVEELAHCPDRDTARAKLGLDQPGGPVVALLPGSRRKEVSRHLPLMLEGVRLLQQELPGLRPVLPIASTVPRELVESAVQASGVSVAVQQGEATTVLRAADAAVVCSGTATLQTALLALPMVVVYRVSWLTFQILKRLVRVAHIALVNLIAGRRLVPELIQHSFTAKNVAVELKRVLTDSSLRAELADGFAAIKNRLGRGDTGEQVAQVVRAYLPDEHPEAEEAKKMRSDV